MRTALEGVRGVSNVQIDFGARTASCTVRGDVSDETIVKAIPDRFTARVQ